MVRTRSILLKNNPTSIQRVRSYDNLSKAAKSKQPIKRRLNYANESLSRAKIAMQNGASIKDVSLEYGIPISTCYDIKKEKYKTSAIGSPTCIEPEVEKILAKAMCQLSMWGFGLNIYQVQIIVKDYLTTSGIPNRFKNNTPGKKWFFHFRKRHADLTLRTAQNFPRNRAESLSKKVIEDFYKMVKDKYDELDMYGKPTHIWNADETGFSGDQGRQLILCKKGLKKYLFSL